MKPPPAIHHDSLGVTTEKIFCQYQMVLKQDAHHIHEGSFQRILSSLR